MTDRTHSAFRWASITPSAAPLEPRPAAIYCGTAGDVVAVGDDGVSETFKAPAGALLTIQPTKITSGPADMVALYNS